MGHITTLANKLMAMEGKRGPISEALQGSQQWVQWRDAVLRPRNELRTSTAGPAGAPPLRRWPPGPPVRRAPCWR